MKLLTNAYRYIRIIEDQIKHTDNKPYTITFYLYCKETHLNSIAVLSKYITFKRIRNYASELLNTLIVIEFYLEFHLYLSLGQNLFDI